MNCRMPLWIIMLMAIGLTSACSKNAALAFIGARLKIPEEIVHLQQIHALEPLLMAQNTLKALGYSQVQPTGHMDDATQKALAQFQTQQGILENGTLDYDTQQMLENARLQSTEPQLKNTEQQDDGYQSIQVFVNGAF